MIEAGTVQNGLKLISVTRVVITGDWRSILPTPAAWRVMTMPFSDRLDQRRRDVGDHVAVAEIAGVAAQADDVGLELAQPHVRRHVHRGHRGGVDDAGRDQAVALLEALHAGLDDRNS